MNTEQLGWTLVHFLWQGALIALLYAVARPFVDRANSRYLLACVALAAMMAAPVVTWRLLRPSGAIPAVAADRNARVPQSVPTIAATLPVAVQTAVPAAKQAPWLRWAVAIWLSGVSALSMRLLASWWLAARLRWKLTRPAPFEWRQTLARLGVRLGIPRAVNLRVSAMVQSPVVIGAWRPLVLVPVGMLTGMPAAQVEALLAHELAHIRRHDYLVNLLQSVAEALLFYHPAVWWVSGHIRQERERCCDDAAVAVSGDVLEYVNALAELVAEPVHLAAVAANGGSLADRIARLLGESRPAPRSGLARGTVLGVVLLAAAAYGVFAQTETRPEFQVASVKLNSENPQRRIVRPQPGGRLMAENAPLQLLIQNAYGVQAYQVVGGPGWVNADGFDIQAKPEGEASTAQMWLMLQSLLADRFKLAVHRETRERPVYALTGAKGSFNPPAPKEDCVTTPPGTPPTPGTFPCGRVGILGAPAGIQMNGVKAPMAEFVRMLAMLMGRPVIDQTGFSGELDVRLSFTPDESTQGLPNSGPGSIAPSSDPTRPNIFAALEEQMRLKLTSSKGPVEVLVIDHAERPTAN